jgi:hypothetical protein
MSDVVFGSSMEVKATLLIESLTEKAVERWWLKDPEKTRGKTERT